MAGMNSVNTVSLPANQLFIIEANFSFLKGYSLACHLLAQTFSL